MSPVKAGGSVQSKFNMEIGRPDRRATVSAVNNEKSRGGSLPSPSPPYSVDGRPSATRKIPHREGYYPLTSCPFSLDNARIFPSGLPAAGNRNGSSLNNAGSNGNYWSSTPNSSNTNNAYGLNFNSGNVNRNNNNRYNGQSVRPVSELTLFYGTLSRPSLFILLA